MSPAQLRSVASHVRQSRPRILDRVGHVAQESARGPAVSDAVVEGERQFSYFADGEFPVDHAGLVDDPPEPGLAL